jgi:hypothetical protein
MGFISYNTIGVNEFYFNFYILFRHGQLLFDLYTCLNAGYKESIVQLEKIGANDVNQKKIFIKFFCTPSQET